MRLFVAVVPPLHVKEHVELALTSVRESQAAGGARGSLLWAPLEDRHITLAFYGEVSAGEAEDLFAGLNRIVSAQPPFELRLRGAGVFDRRIFWIGCGGDVGALSELTAGCVHLGRMVTGREDRRVRSRSHVTVARVRAQARTNPGRNRGGNGNGEAGRDDVATLARALAVYEGPSWHVEEIQLVSSRPGEGRSGGPAYDVVDTFALLGPATSTVERT